MPQWLSVISDGNPGLNLWLAITSDSNPLFKRKGAVHPSLNYFIFLHPRSDVRFSASFLEQEEKSSLLPNTFSFMIFQESICAKLGGTMRILEIKGNAFRISISQS